MPNKILKILLKPKQLRTIPDLLTLNDFYEGCTLRQFRFSLMYENAMEKEIEMYQNAKILEANETN